MVNLPPYLFFPASVPTQDPAIAGMLTQLQLSLNQWSVQVVEVIQELQRQIDALTP